MTASSSSAASKQKVARLAFWTIVVAFVVLGLKLLAWWLTGSVALYSDALESTVNVIAALAAFWAIRVSHTPADQDHPFGHHKAEYFSAVLEGVLIVMAALLILVEVARTWSAPANLEEPWTGLAINSVASVINLLWAQILIRTGRAERSPALIADGRHIMTDVVTSVGVVAGLIAAVLTGWSILDPAAGSHRRAQHPLAGLARYRLVRAGPDGPRCRQGRAFPHPRHHLSQFQGRAGGA